MNSHQTQAKAAGVARQEFHDACDLAQRWQLSERQVRRILASGAIKVTRFGCAVRIAAADLALYEARCAGVM